MARAASPCLFVHIMQPKSRWTLKNKPLQVDLNSLQSIKDLQLLVDMTNLDDSPGSSDGEVAFEEAHVPAPTRESVPAPTRTWSGLELRLARERTERIKARYAALTEPAVVVRDCQKKIKCGYCNKLVSSTSGGLKAHQSHNMKCIWKQEDARQKEAHQMQLPQPFQTRATPDAGNLRMAWEEARERDLAADRARRFTQENNALDLAPPNKLKLSSLNLKRLEVFLRDEDVRKCYAEAALYRCQTGECGSCAGCG